MPTCLCQIDREIVRRIIAGKAYDTKRRNLWPAAAMTMSYRTLDGLSTGQALEPGSRWQLGMMEWLKGFNRSQTPRPPLAGATVNRLVEKILWASAGGICGDHKGLHFSRRAFVAAIGVLGCLKQATSTPRYQLPAPSFQD